MSRPALTAALMGLSVLLAISCMEPSVRPADLVLRGGRVVTVDADNPEGQAVAILGDRILQVGSDAQIDAYVGPDTEVIELEGRLVIPGFIESHAHFMGIGNAQLQLPLAEAGSWSEIVAMVEAAVAGAAPGELIRGRGWHQEKWSETPVPNVDGVPLHAELSAVSPDNPVILTHASGHATFANASAMRIAGIDRTTENPPGGEILHDAAGEPTGLFRETASRLLGPARQSANPPDPRRVARLANEEVVAKGVTTLHDAGSGLETVALLREMAEAGELDVRLWIMLSASNEELAEHAAEVRAIGEANHHFTVRAIKRSIDGALGSHGAWLLEPYRDLPSSSGLNTTSLEGLEETARLALEHDLQLCVHAIGDRANRETLDIFQEAFESGAAMDLRWRVEHAQHLHPDDIARFAELDVIASMEGIHATSDAPFVLARLGAQRAREGAYMWRTLMETGAVVTNGTDAPVEDVDPIASYHATVSRRLVDGSVFFEAERLDRMEALRTYTINGAYAGFEDELKGSLTPGKLADLVVLSIDILSVPEEQIPNARVDLTVIGGEVVFRR